MTGSHRSRGRRRVLAETGVFNRRSVEFHTRLGFSVVGVDPGWDASSGEPDGGPGTVRFELLLDDAAGTGRDGEPDG